MRFLSTRIVTLYSWQVKCFTCEQEERFRQPACLPRPPPPPLPPAPPLRWRRCTTSPSSARPSATSAPTSSDSSRYWVRKEEDISRHLFAGQYRSLQRFPLERVAGRGFYLLEYNRRSKRKFHDKTGIVVNHSSLINESLINR